MDVPQIQFEQFSCPKSNAELQEIAHWCLDETNNNKLSLAELEQIEEKLDVALRKTMSKKASVIMNTITSLRKKGKMLQEERRFLQTVAMMEKVETGADNADISEGFQSTLAAEGLATGSVNTSEGNWWQPLQHLHFLMDM